MSVPEMIAEARKDFAAIRNKLDAPLHRLRKEHIRRGRREDLLHLLPPWRAPKTRNNWLLLIKQTKSGPRMFTMTYFWDKEGKMAALWTTYAGLAFYIDAHVIERYGLRFDPTNDHQERLCSFFLENHFFSLDLEEQLSEDCWNVTIGMNQGMGLGQWHRDQGYVFVGTFINHGQLFQNQEDAMERMDLEREILSLTRGQRTAFVALYKRTFPQDVGSPGMQWLESLAA